MFLIIPLGKGGKPGPLVADALRFFLWILPWRIPFIPTLSARCCKAKPKDILVSLHVEFVQWNWHNLISRVILTKSFDVSLVGQSLQHRDNIRDGEIVRPTIPPADAPIVIQHLYDG
jgi:hypothetical protein